MALSAKARKRLEVAMARVAEATEVADAIDAGGNASSPTSSDSTDTPGDVTQNTDGGRVAVASGSSSLTVTNNKITSSSKVFAMLQTADITLTQILSVIPTTGAFTINGNGTATGNVNVCWKLEE